MTEIQNIWLCTESRELIRADRVVSLLFDDHGVQPQRVRARVLGGFRQDTMRTVSLLECHEGCGTRAVADLAITLGRAAAQSGSAVFVYANRTDDNQPGWEIAAEPPSS